MFDLTSSKLLILAVVALLVVGPKDLPALLRTVGRYMGMIKRQADEFRRQFEDAMRETELADLKKEVEDLGKEAHSTLDEASRTVESHMDDVSREVNDSLAEIDKPADAAISADTPEHMALDAPLDSDTSGEPLPALPASSEEATPVAERSDVIQAPPAAQPREVPAVAEAAGSSRSGA